MLRQGFIRIALALTLAAMGPVPWSLPAALAGDTNGDHVVDVIDLQMALAALLQPDVSAKLSDINGDGVVDILDVQQLLNQTGETSSPEPLKDGPKIPEGVPSPTVPQPHAPGAVLHLLASFELPHAPVHTPLPVDVDIGPPPSEFRLVRGLSSHAPPATAWNNV